MIDQEDLYLGRDTRPMKTSQGDFFCFVLFQGIHHAPSLLLLEDVNVGSEVTMSAVLGGAGSLISRVCVCVCVS